jgi:hypothetical protein
MKSASPRVPAPAPGAWGASCSRGGNVTPAGAVAAPSFAGGGSGVGVGSGSSLCVTTATGFFLCSKCQNEQAVIYLKVRSNQRVCKMCSSNYEAFVQRWKNNKQLRIWWQSQTPAQQTQWYKDQLGHGFGATRKFDIVEYSETSTKAFTTSDLSLNNFVPVSIFIRNCFMEGINRATAIQLFNKFVNEHTQLCRHENGQWHVPDYGGIQVARGTTSSDGYNISRSSRPGGEEQMKSLVDAGREMLEKSVREAADNPMCLVAVAQDVPQVARSTSEAARPAIAPTTLSALVASEVPGRNTIENQSLSKIIPEHFHGGANRC